MRKIFLLVAMLLINFIFSQEFKFEEVVKVDSTITKEELFNRARSWILNTYKNEKEVLSVQDKDSGELSGRGSANFKSERMYFGVLCVNGTINYKFSIYVKDGRYKYMIYSFTHEGSYYDISNPISYGLLTTDEEPPKPSRGGANKKAWAEIKSQAIAKADILIKSFVKS